MRRFPRGHEQGFAVCEITSRKLDGRWNAPGLGIDAQRMRAPDGAGGKASRMGQAKMKVGRRLSGLEYRFAALGGLEAQIPSGDARHAA